jgi:hypothetical protein
MLTPSFAFGSVVIGLMCHEHIMIAVCHEHRSLYCCRLAVLKCAQALSSQLRFDKVGVLTKSHHTNGWQKYVPVLNHRHHVSVRRETFRRRTRTRPWVYHRQPQANTIKGSALRLVLHVDTSIFYFDLKRRADRCPARSLQHRGGSMLDHKQETSGQQRDDSRSKLRSVVFVCGSCN